MLTCRVIATNQDGATTVTSDAVAVVSPPTGIELVASVPVVLDHSASSTHTVNLPSGLVEGDFVIFVLAADEGIAPDSDGSPVITSPGWSELWAPYSGSPGRFLGTKVMGAVPDVSVSVTIVETPFPDKIVVGFLRVYRNVHPTTPFDAEPEMVQTSTNGYPDPPALTTVTPEAMRVIIGYMDDRDVAPSVSAPTGFSNLMSVDTGRGLTNNSATVMVADRLEPAPGTLDPEPFSASAPDAWGAAHLALRPSGQPSQSPNQGVQRVQATHSDDFVESLGVNTHVNWGNAWAGQSWRQPLADLGIRYHRSMIGAQAQARSHVAWLYENAGMKVLATCARNKADSGDPIYPTFDHGEVTAYLDFIKDQVGAEKVLAVEGPNEDNRPAKTSGWHERIRDVQQHIWDSVKSSINPTFAALPVVAPSMYRRDVNDAAAMGDLTGMADRANIHYYTAGFQPTIGNIRQDDSTAFLAMDDVLAPFEANVPGAPLWVTEFGYPVQTISGHNYNDLSYVTPLAQAKYLPRGLAEFYRRGHRHMSIYALFDDYPDKGDFNHFGLIEHSSNQSMTPRPAYHAVRRLVAALSDPGPPFTPDVLEFAVLGETEGVKHILFQRRDGRFKLMIWHDAESYNRTEFLDLNVDPRDVTLVLGQQAQSITVHKILDGSMALLGENTTSASILVPDHIQLIEIVP